MTNASIMILQNDDKAMLYSKKRDSLNVNSTPFVRQVWEILGTKEWGAYLCQKEYPTKSIHVWSGFVVTCRKREL